MAAHLARKASPLVVIVGATGTGKSKLAIELASKFHGEVVSADSMQVYHGLDIITNKVSAAEQTACPHHMIGFVDPLVSTYTVVDFRSQALPLIEDILLRGKLPFIVGGTNYYIEALLWDTLLTSNTSTEMSSSAAVATERASRTELLKLGSSELYRRLEEVDPEMACCLHPRNVRKLIRGLQVYEQVGIPWSSLLRRQHEQPGGGPLSGPLRYPDACVLWLYANQEALDRRLDERVDQMLAEGLLEELQSFHRHYALAKFDFQQGIFQSIGFKEFHDYLNRPLDCSVQESEKLLQKGIEALKLATRRYARKQYKWVKNRFLQRPQNNLPPVFGLDATDPSLWEKAVLEPAVSIVESCLQGETPVVSAMNMEPQNHSSKQLRFNCDFCSKIIIGERQWHAHLRSKGHRYHVKKNRRKVTELAKTVEHNPLNETLELQRPSDGETSQ
uniref:tRNA dimethylallyltransferase n=1 Tax=Eptatretus burgeri TaxID=7764 RepID=A0A8C4WYS7_EPTBU